MKLSLGMLIVVMAVSGCIGLPSGFFGQNVLDIQTSVVQEGSRDILVTENIQTIPTSPLLPEQPLVLSFIVENTDRLKTARGVYVDMFNAPTLSSQSRELCNSLDRPCQPDIDCRINERCSVFPGEQKAVNFNLITPSEEDIANIRTQTRLEFRTVYSQNTSLLFVLPAVNMDEVVRRQQAGDQTTIQISKSHGSGPVQIDMELVGAPYMLTNFASTFVFKVRNVGSGNVLNSRINSESLVIRFPVQFEVTNSPEFFTCDANVCFNNREIDIFRDETRTSMRFEAGLTDAARRDIDITDTPFRSYEIKADLEYTYELRDSVDITINPFQNV